MIDPLSSPAHGEVEAARSDIEKPQLPQLRPDLADRITTLDLLRGLAVMGILLMNVFSFALPAGAYFNPAALGPPSTADTAIWAVQFVLVDGKMRALFSILFGAGLALVYARAEQAGQDGIAIHLNRVGWLAVIGVAHLCLLWPGDILLHYAVVGTVALAFIHESSRRLIGWATGLLLAQAMILATLIAAFLAVRSSGGAEWQEVAGSIGGFSPGAIAADRATFLQSWRGFVADRAVEAWDITWFHIVYGGAETLALMLLGMAALRSGLLTGDWSRARLARLAAWSYAVSLPPTLALLGWCLASRLEPLTVYAASQLGGLPFRPVMAFGHAALALLLFAAGGGLASRVAAAGQMALSNYLGTSILLAPLFFGWGLGLYGAFGRTELLGVVAAVWAMMLLWSKPWLRRFRYGPFEWLWRSLARRSPQPLRRPAIARQSHSR